MNRRTHLYLFDLASSKLDTLTRGTHNEGSPEWSPDGKQIAFVSNRTDEPDKNENTDIWIMDARPNAKPKQLTTWTGSDTSPRWSADGKTIAYLRSTSPEKYIMYDQNILAVVSSSGGEPRLLTSALDRPVSTITWDKGASSLSFLVSDDRQRYIGRAKESGGPVTKVASGNRSYGSLESVGPDTFISLMSEPQLPAEIYAVENGAPRRLTRHQEDFIAPIAFASVEGFTSKSKDGTQVSNILFRPADAKAKEKLPTVFWIHGGPVGQDEFGFHVGLLGLWVGFGQNGGKDIQREAGAFKLSDFAAARRPKA